MKDKTIKLINVLSKITTILVVFMGIYEMITDNFYNGTLVFLVGFIFLLDNKLNKINENIEKLLGEKYNEQH